MRQKTVAGLVSRLNEVTTSNARAATPAPAAASPVGAAGSEPKSGKQLDTERKESEIRAEVSLQPPGVSVLTIAIHTIYVAKYVHWFYDSRRNCESFKS